MYFVNMLGKSGLKEFRGECSKAIPFVNTVDEIKDSCKIVLEDNKLVVSESGTNLFGKGIVPESGDLEELYLPKINKAKKTTYKMIQDTDDNPLIMVLCKELAIYDGIPANIQYMYLGDDYILACLIQGACEFDCVPMQRCDTSILDGRKLHTYSGKDLKGISDYKDGESGYNYLWDTVCQVVISINSSSSSKSYRTVKENINYITEENLLAYRKKVAEMKAKKEAEEKARKERIAKEQAERAKQLAEEEKRREEEAKLKATKSTRGSTKSSSTNKKVNTYNEGAKAFLQAVAFARSQS